MAIAVQFQGGRTLARPTPASLELVRDHGWLAACSPEFRAWALAGLMWRHYPAGRTITLGGEEVGGLYCVGAGQLTFTNTIGAIDAAPCQFLLPGMWWGYAPLIGSGRAGTVTVRNAAICGALPAGSLRARLADHPAEWRDIAIGLADQVMLSGGAHGDLMLADPRRRVAATILRLAGYRHRIARIRVPDTIACTHQELADATGLSRNTVGKLVRSLVDDGIISWRYGRLGIVERRPLRLMANGEAADGAIG